MCLNGIQHVILLRSLESIKTSYMEIVVDSIGLGVLFNICELKSKFIQSMLGYNNLASHMCLGLPLIEKGFIPAGVV